MLDSTSLNPLSVAELQSLIAEAEAALTTQLRNQRRSTIAKMRELAASVGIDFEIIEKPSPKAHRSSPAAPKYRNPANPEQTWSGRGKRPKWIREAIDSGADIAAMEVSSVA